MKNFAKYLTVLTLAALLVSPLMADDNNKKEKKGKGKGKGESQLLNSTLKKLEKADLNDEQKTKITELAKQWQGKIAEVNAKAKLSKEQRQKMVEAKKAAVAEGKKGKDVAAAVKAAVELTAEQKEAHAAAMKLHKEFNKEVMALITDDQKEKIARKPKKKDKKKKDEAKSE